MTRIGLVMMLGLCWTLAGCPKDPPAGDDDTGDDDATGDDDTGDDDATGDDDTSGDDDATGDDDTTGDDLARWSFLVFMNGDNDLEVGVWLDLNELEGVGSGDGVHVLVQADRHPDYFSGDDDWWDTRRYYITADGEGQAVTSEVVEELGELDMGDPAVLSDFLMWAHTNYPAERMALILWDHGDGWTIQTPADDGPQGAVSWDETDGGDISIARGELRDALADIVAARGPLDLVGFDACNMANWEVAHSLRTQALTMAASEATVDMEGFQYERALMLLRDEAADADGYDLAVELAESAVEYGAEWTFSATDLGGMDDLAARIDDLAAAVLADPTLDAEVLRAREDARGADFDYPDYYLDLRDFVEQLAAGEEPALYPLADGILTEMDQCVLGSYSRPPMDFVGGLTVFFDFTPGYITAYTAGDGATWSQETRWDELVAHLASL